MPIKNKKHSFLEKAETLLLTKYGEFRCVVFRSSRDGREHVALVKGYVDPSLPILTRIHSECLTGEVFSSLHCDCKEQLEKALRLIARRGSGVFLYLRQEGRGIGLLNKIRAYALQREGYDTVEANEKLGFASDARDFRIAYDILNVLGVRKVALLTNNPEKISVLKEGGFEVTRVPHAMRARATNRFYLLTKKRKMKHLLS